MSAVGAPIALVPAVVAAVLAGGPWRWASSPRPLPHHAEPAGGRPGFRRVVGQVVDRGRSAWTGWTGWSGGVLLRLIPRSSGDDPSARAARLGASVTLGVLAAMVSPVLGVAAAGLIWARPAWQERSRRRRRQRDLIEDVPDLVELFRLAIGAGLSVHQSVRALAVRLHGPGADALDEVVARQDGGERLADGLEGLARRGEPLRPLGAALTAAERYGAPLGPALDRAASEAREVRRRQAEEAARRLPVLLLFPLVLCILPAAALLTVVPLLAASWPRLAG